LTFKGIAIALRVEEVKILQNQKQQKGDVMKKLVCSLAMFIIFLLGLGFGFSSLADDETEGKINWKVMKITHQVSKDPIPSLYFAQWYSMNMAEDNEKVSYERWIRFIIKNDNGVGNIEIEGDSEGKISWTTPTETFQMVSYIDKNNSHDIFGEPTSKFVRLVLVLVKPDKKDKLLKITVTDNLGNIAGDYIPIKSIPEASPNKEDAVKTIGKIKI
jgi:hypothetical protein